MFVIWENDDVTRKPAIKRNMGEGEDRMQLKFKNKILFWFAFWVTESCEQYFHFQGIGFGVLDICRTCDVKRWSHQCAFELWNVFIILVFRSFFLDELRYKAWGKEKNKRKKKKLAENSMCLQTRKICNEFLGSFFKIKLTIFTRRPRTYTHFSWIFFYLFSASHFIGYHVNFIFLTSRCLELIQLFPLP